MSLSTYICFCVSFTLPVWLDHNDLQVWSKVRRRPESSCSMSFRDASHHWTPAARSGSRRKPPAPGRGSVSPSIKNAASLLNPPILFSFCWRAWTTSMQVKQTSGLFFFLVRQMLYLLDFSQLWHRAMQRVVSRRQRKSWGLCKSGQRERCLTRKKCWAACTTVLGMPWLSWETWTKHWSIIRKT